MLDGPLTFADRSQAEKLASHWNDNLRADRQDPMVTVLAVEDFYDVFVGQLDINLLFTEQERA